MKSNVKSFSLLMIITIIGKILAFLFEAIIASNLGVGVETDSYFSVAELYTLIDSAFLGAITVVALNKYSIISAEKNENEAYRYISNMISVVFPIVAFVSLLFVIFASPLSYVISPGSNIEARYFVIRCIKVMAVLPPIISFTSVGLAVLRYKKQFVITGLKSLLISIVGSLGILLFKETGCSGTDILSLSLIVSNIIFCLIVWSNLLKFGRISLKFPKLTPDASDSLKMAMPLMLSYGITNVSLFVDKIIVSTVGEGAVSSLTYAQSIYNCVATIFISNLCTILLTDFNQLCARKDFLAVNKKLKNTISLGFILLIPVTVETVFFHKEIVSLIYERGNFSSKNSITVGMILLSYAFNFIPAMIYNVYNQILFACGETKKSMLIALASLMGNIIVSLALIKPIGVCGIAIGTVVSSVISAIFAKIVVGKTIGIGKMKFEIRYVLGALILCVFCVCINGLFQYFSIPFVISFFITTCLCYLGVLVFMLFTKNEYVLSVIKKILDLFRNLIKSRSTER